jgi:F-type H+-transporting ATPase subunit alpha
MVDVGTVTEVGDGIARVYGLDGAMAGELLEFEVEGDEKVSGMALNLENSNVGVVILGNDRLVTEGCRVRTTGRNERLGPAP